MAAVTQPVGIAIAVAIIMSLGGLILGIVGLRKLPSDVSMTEAQTKRIEVARESMVSEASTKAIAAMRVAMDDMERTYNDKIKVLTEHADRNTARVCALEQENARQKIVMEQQARQISEQARKLAEQSEQLATSALDISTQARKLSEQAGQLAEKDRLIVKQAQEMSRMQERITVLESDLAKLQNDKAVGRSA